ncbi:hypothetical protein ACQY0O_006461 [Thecaphora frezii]
MIHRLPPEIQLAVLGSPTLSLLDLARLCLVHPSLIAVARAVASRHRSRRIFLTSLGFVPEDVLNAQQWCAAKGVDRVEKVWGCFVDDLAYDVVNNDIVDIADLFSRLSRWVFRHHRGFPPLCGGSLPSIPRLEDAEGGEEAAGARVDMARDHRFFLFAHAVVYAATRGLNRRATLLHPAAGQDIAEEYVEFDTETREEMLRREFERLRSAMLRCDPLGIHVERLQTAKPAAVDQEQHGGSPRAASIDPRERLCGCFDRSWATWYLAAWHQLWTRYRRFTSPDDISHIAYRTILSAVPAFPTSTHLATVNDAAASASSASAFEGSSSSQRQHRDPLLLSTHLNPDSMLFSLRESKTFARTKALFNLTEHALAPGMARLWAGNVGYAWGEGGSLWPEESRRSAETRLSRSVRGAPRPAPDPAGTAGAMDVAAMHDEPIHSVLLAHARWRARTFLRWLRTERQGGKAERMLDRARSFDIHFVRRSLQIQQWAGLDGIPATGPRRVARAQVHPSSPFLAFERTRNGKRRSYDGVWSSLSGLRRRADKDDRERWQRVEEAGWKAILAPIVGYPFDDADAGWTAAGAASLRDRALLLLGDLHDGLVHPCLSPPPGTAAAGGEVPLCIELYDSPPLSTAPSIHDEATKKGTSVFFSDTSPPGQPDTGPFLVKPTDDRWADDLTALCPSNAMGRPESRGWRWEWRRFRCELGLSALGLGFGFGFGLVATAVAVVLVAAAASRVRW